MFKKKIKGKTVRSIGIYSGLNFINSAIPFLLLPVLTNKLTRVEYAVVDIFVTLGFIFLPIVGLNIGASVIRYYYEKEKYDLSTFLSSVLIFLVGSGVVVVGLVILSRGYISRIFGEEALYEILVLAVLYALFNQICEILLSLYRASEKAVNYGVFRVSKTVLDFGVTIILILFVYAGWESRVYTALLVSCLFALVAIGSLVKNLNLKFVYDKAYVKVALAYSAPLIVHSISSRVISYIDRYFILHFYDLETVGLYSVACQVGMIMSFVGTSINMAWTPMLFSKLKKGGDEVKKQMKKSNIYLVVFYVALALLIFLFVPFIYKYFIGKDFSVAPSLVFIILISYAFRACYLIYINYMFYFKKTLRLSIYTMVCMGINVLLCWYLIPVYGIYGAAYATLICIGMQFLLVFLDYKKNINVYFRDNGGD